MRSACGVPLLVSAAATGASTMPATRNRTNGSRRRCQQTSIPAISSGAMTQSSIPPISRVLTRVARRPAMKRKFGLKYAR